MNHINIKKLKNLQSKFKITLIIMNLKIIHRGWFGKYPENTLLAFKEAFVRNYDGIETDLQLTKDNMWILHHDDNLERLFNIPKKMNQINYSEINNIIWNNEITEIKITKLYELIQFNKNYQKILNLEIKEDFDNTSLQNINNLFDICKSQKNKVIFSSFDWNWYSIINKQNFQFAHLIKDSNKLPDCGNIYIFDKNDNIPDLPNIKIGIYTLKLQEHSDKYFQIIDPETKLIEG